MDGYSVIAHFVDNDKFSNFAPVLRKKRFAFARKECRTT